MKMENERICIEISEHGAEVTRIYDKKKETELLWEGNPTYWKRHSPILFPNVGKTYKNKVKINGISYPTSGHGFARDNDFKCICTKPDKAAFLFSSGEETKEVYSFDFSFFQINNSVSQLHQVVQTMFRYQNCFSLFFYQPQMFL